MSWRSGSRRWACLVVSIRTLTRSSSHASSGWLGWLLPPASGWARDRPRPAIASPPAAFSPTLNGLSADLVRSAVGAHVNVADLAPLSEQLDLTRSANVPEAADLVLTAERIAEPFGPKSFETECGIKVRGARMVDVFATRAKLDAITPDGQVVRIDAVDGAAASVLVTFESGDGALVPCMPGFITGLTVHDGELVDIACEPCTTNWRWAHYVHSAGEIRSLRGIASSSAQHGHFRIDNDDAGDLAQKMQYAKMFDPTHGRLRRLRLLRPADRYGRSSDVGGFYARISV